MHLQVAKRDNDEDRLLVHFPDGDINTSAAKAYVHVTHPHAQGGPGLARSPQLHVQRSTRHQ